MANKLTGNEIIKLIDNLIGPTEAYGDSAVDERIHANLKTLIEVTDWCLDGVHQSSETIKKPEFSMRLVGTTAYKALERWADWLGDMFGKDEDK